MQIIEVSCVGVRSAVITLERPHTPLRFVLFPMIHIGRREFYQAVSERVARCAVVVAEGKPEGRRRRSLPGMAYRLLRRHRRTRLVYQPSGEEALGIPVVRPDMSTAEIHRHLRRLPVLTYALAYLTLWVLLPWFLLYLLFFGAERFLVSHLALDDDTPYTDPSPGERMEAIDRVIMDDRDALLLDALSKIYEERSAEGVDIAVVYGAAHMPAVVHGMLRRYGYRPRGAEWLTVFDIDD
jgi:hypothetical protein